MAFDSAPLLEKAWTQRRAGRAKQARAIARMVLDRAPEDHAALYFLGVLDFEGGDADSAAQLLGRAVAAAPDLPAYRTNYAVTLDALGRADEAEAEYRAAIALDPGSVFARTSLAILLLRQWRLTEAADEARKSLDLALDQPELLSNYYLVAARLCDWPAAEWAMARLREAAAEGSPVVPYALYVGPADGRELLNSARNAANAASRRVGAPGWEHERKAKDRLRIGYLGNDFQSHVIAWLMAGIFEEHDRSRFEVAVLSYGPPDSGPDRRRIEAASDLFLDLRESSDAEAARRIHQAGIDVLVDLKGHVPTGRLGIAALRPAPVQAGYMGYLGTMGGDFHDYALVDEIVVPPAERADYSESLVYLPDSYYPHDAKQPRPAPCTRAEAGLPENAFVFCSLNSEHKFNRPMFDLWMRLLAKTPGAVLWLTTSNAWARAALHREAEARGIAASRVIVSGAIDRDLHFARLATADLFLDTLPYGSHTTGLDALWMGVPFLTCTGATPVGRVGTSLLHAVGLPEMVTRTLEEYEETALMLARSPERLAAIRARLANAPTRAPLFDTKAKCRALEAAYLGMWERFAARRPPESFAVEITPPISA